MQGFLVVVVLAAVAMGAFKCSSEPKPPVEQQNRMPEQVQGEIERQLEQGAIRNRRALEDAGAR